MRDDSTLWRNALIALAAASLIVAGLGIIVYVSIARDRILPTPTRTPTLLPPTATPNPLPRPSSVPLASTSGVVREYSPGALIIVITSAGGTAEQVIVPENLQVTWESGQRASPMEISPGQMLYAEGELDPLGRLIAARITIRRAPDVPDERLPTATWAPQLVPTDTPSPTAQQGWRGEYFANPELSGSPVLVRSDPAIDFQWQTGAPAPGLPADRFSVLWRAKWLYDAGGYRFHALADDGVRVWVDGVIVIDSWRDQPATLSTGDVHLSAGEHDVHVAYYERTDGAQVRVWWEYRGAYPDWKAQYYDNAQLTGEPVLVRNEVEVRADWGAGAPGPNVPVDRFGARWTRAINLEGGAYRFIARGDDGIRVWVDSPLVIDEWHQSTLNTYVGHIWLDAGPHDVRIEFYEEVGNAAIQVWWERIETFMHWQGDYFANPALTGRPVFLRDDERIDFDWGVDSPGLGMPGDNYSVRWQREVHLDAGIYRFFALADDGVRVYVDGARQIDEWHDSRPDRHTADIVLEKGAHSIVIEYYERGDRARIEVGWEQLGTPTPTATPVPTATSTPLPPTATDSPTPTSTWTEVPASPTATATSIPPDTPTPDLSLPAPSPTFKSRPGSLPGLKSTPTTTQG